MKEYRQRNPSDVGKLASRLRRANGDRQIGELVKLVVRHDAVGRQTLREDVNGVSAVSVGSRQPLGVLMSRPDTRRLFAHIRRQA